mgnify:CR=1
MAALLYLAILHMHYVAMLECFLCFHNSIFYFANLNIISQSCKYLAKIFLHAAVTIVMWRSLDRMKREESEEQYRAVGFLLLCYVAFQLLYSLGKEERY